MTHRPFIPTPRATVKKFIPIFDETFLVSVPQFELIDEDTVREIGTFSTGSRALDSGIANTMTLTWLSIDKMAKIYSHGSTVHFRNPKEDIPRVHQIIQRHINEYLEWEHRSESRLSYTDPERQKRLITDFKLLDAFGRGIYETNGTAYREYRPRSYLDQFSPLTTVSAPQVVHEELPQYESIKFSALAKRKKYRAAR